MGISDTRIRRRLTLGMALMLAALSALALASCDNSGEADTPTATGIPATETATPRAAPSSTPPPPQDLRRGGVLQLAVKTAPPHQDVHQSSSVALASWGAGIAYSRLLSYRVGPDVPTPSRIPECDLCESWEQTGPLEYDFVVRSDARFHDLPPVNGRPLTAHDIVFSYERQMSDGWANEELLRNIESVEALDDTHLRIKLTTADAELFERLADGRSRIVPREAVELDGDLVDGPTVGSGPWILEEFSSSSATFEVNRDYYDDKVPYLDGLAVQYIEQDSTRIAAVRVGALDFTSGTYDDVQAALERFPEMGTATLLEPGTGVEVALNTSREPLDSLEVRQAVLAAWDVEAAISQIWDGQARLTAGLNLPEPSWQPDFMAEYGSLFGDTEMANELLSDAGLTPADTLTIRVGEYGDRYTAMADSLASALTGVGMAVDVERVTTRIFAENVWLGGDYDIFVGAPPPVASLSGQLFGIYHSDGPWNTTGYSTPELDALIERQAVESDPLKRGNLALQIQDAIMAGSHRFSPATGMSHWLWGANVHGVNVNTSGADSDFLTHVWIES